MEEAPFFHFFLPSAFHGRKKWERRDWESEPEWMDTRETWNLNNIEEKGVLLSDKHNWPLIDLAINTLQFYIFEYERCVCGCVNAYIWININEETTQSTSLKKNSQLNRPMDEQKVQSRKLHRWILLFAETNRLGNETEKFPISIEMQVQPVGP